MTALLRLGSASANQANAPASAPPGSTGGARFSAAAMGSLLAAQGAQQGGAATSGASILNDASAGAQGASTTITTNADGSITTTTTYADGTVATTTTPATSAMASGSAKSNGGQSDATQFLKMLSNGIQALAPAAALLAVL
ncbi:MAG TPA: hypothetical protein VFL51_13035 [Pseudolabrys sp.]|nr:hypothetical protein [Pseudolabrys sp.]